MITTTSSSILVAIIVALITAIVGPIIVNWVKMKMEKPPSTTPMHDALETSTLVDTQLENMMEELECDRIWIAQFHNGGYFYPTGRSIQKFSIFYEKCSPDVPTIQNTFQNIPVSLFPRPIAKVYKENELAIPNLDEAKDTYGLEYFASQCETKGSYLIGLHSLDNHLIGIMGISYKTPHDLKKDQWIYIRQKVGAIGTLLSEYLYQNQPK